MCKHTVWWGYKIILQLDVPTCCDRIASQQQSCVPHPDRHPVWLQAKRDTESLCCMRSAPQDFNAELWSGTHGWTSFAAATASCCPFVRKERRKRKDTGAQGGSADCNSEWGENTASTKSWVRPAAERRRKQIGRANGGREMEEIAISKGGRTLCRRHVEMATFLQRHTVSCFTSAPSAPLSCLSLSRLSLSPTFTYME